MEPEAFREEYAVEVHAPENRVVRGPFRTGRKVPGSVEAERSLLACCLLDGGVTLARCQAAGLRERSWAGPGFGKFWLLLEGMARKGLPIETDVVAAELERTGAAASMGEALRVIGELLEESPTTVNAPYFLERVREQWVLRELVLHGAEMLERCYEWTGDNLVDLTAEWVGKLQRAAEWLGRKGATPGEEVDAVIERVRASAAGKIDRSRWMHTGIRRFDEQLLPFDVSQEDFLIILMAPPSDGKSSLARGWVRHNALQGRRCAMFLLETTVSQCLLLMAATGAKLNARQIHSMLPEQVARLEAELGKLREHFGKNLFLRDDVFTIDDIEAQCQLLAQSAPLDLVVIDYVQIIQTRRRNNGRNREQEVAEIAGRLKILGKRLKCPIIGLAQVSREAEREMKSAQHDGDGKLIHRLPQKTDLRESGAIEQAADRVIGIYTPPEDSRGAEQGPNQAIREVWLCQVKSRNGPTGYIRCWFNRMLTMFYDFSAGEQEHSEAQATKTGSYAGKKRPAGGGH